MIVHKWILLWMLIQNNGILFRSSSHSKLYVFECLKLDKSFIACLSPSEWANLISKKRLENLTCLIFNLFVCWEASNKLSFCLPNIYFSDGWKNKTFLFIFWESFICMNSISFVVCKHWMTPHNVFHKHVKNFQKCILFSFLSCFSCIWN